MSVAVGPGTWVELHYVLRSAKGAVLERTRDAGEPLGFAWGEGSVVPGLEAALEGAFAGDVLTVDVACEDAYGPRTERDVFAVDRGEFPAAVVVGDEVDVEGEDGAELTLRVLAVHDDHVMVDANHPFAGMDLAFTVDVVSVRAVR